VSAFVYMQARSVGNEEARAALDDTQRRIAAIAQVHRRLYTGDSVTIDVAYRDPGLAYLYALRKTLADQTLTIEGGLDPRVPHDTAAQLDTLFVMKSPPLREILPALEKPSQNQIAEIFFKTLGLERTGVGTADSGRAVIERQLVDWCVHGFPPKEIPRPRPGRLRLGAEVRPD